MGDAVNSLAELGDIEMLSARGTDDLERWWELATPAWQDLSDSVRDLLPVVTFSSGLAFGSPVSGDTRLVG